MVSPIYLYGGFLSHAGTPIETPIYGILHMGNMNEYEAFQVPNFGADFFLRILTLQL